MSSRRTWAHAPPCDRRRRSPPLRLSSTFQDAAEKSPRSLSVAPVQASGLTADRRYVYVRRADPAELHQAASLFWETPPARALEQALVDGLRARFVAVAGPDAGMAADQRVIVRLDQFDEATGAGQAQARVAFEVTALDTATHRLRLSGHYCASAPIKGEAPSDRAAAFSAATASAVTRLAQDLAAGASGAAC